MLTFGFTSTPTQVALKLGSQKLLREWATLLTISDDQRGIL